MAASATNVDCRCIQCGPRGSTEREGWGGNRRTVGAAGRVATDGGGPGWRGLRGLMLLPGPVEVVSEGVAADDL